MENDIEAYKKTPAKQEIPVRVNPDVPLTRNTLKKSKKSGRIIGS